MSSHMENSNPSTMQSSYEQPEKVEVNVYGVPISKNAGKISSRIGKLVRVHVPVSYESWKKVPQKYKDDVWSALLKVYEIDLNAKDYFIKRMAETYRRHKSDLRTNYYDKYDNDEDRKKHCPRGISQHDWDAFLVNERNPEAKKRELGKKNRSSYTYAHHTGHKSHSALEHEMAIVNPSKEITRREVWEKAHTKKDGSISDSASSYFDKITKIKETINDDDEEVLPLDNDIISQMFGKDSKGRTRSIGTKISRTQVNASAIARKQSKSNEGIKENLQYRVENLEDAMTSVKQDVSQVLSILKHGQPSFVNTNEVGSNSNAPLILQDRCEILNSDLEVIATCTVVRDSTSSIIHGKSVPSTHEKLLIDSLLMPNERTNKLNHPNAMTFDDIGVGGYVAHPKTFLRYF